MTRPLAALALLVMCATRASAQAAADHFAAGVHAYDELQFSAAADHLRRAITPGDGALTGRVRSQAMAYLGAAEWFQNHPDSTAAVFRRLVLQDPGFRLDTLRFPPTITGVYDALRKQTYTVRADVAPTTEIRLGDARALVTLTSATPHRVRASLVREGAPAQKLLETTVSDTATVTWDGRFGSVAASDGTYDLAIASFDASGRPIHEAHVSVVVWTQHPDTLPYPDYPGPASAGMPIAVTPSGSRVLPLVWGVLSAGAALLLPKVVNGSSPTVYGGVAAGIIGAVALGGALRPGAAAPPAHLTVSPAKFDTRRWADSVSAVRTENARRLSHDVTLHLRIAAKGDEDQQ